MYYLAKIFPISSPTIKCELESMPRLFRTTHSSSESFSSEISIKKKINGWNSTDYVFVPGSTDGGSWEFQIFFFVEVSDCGWLEAVEREPWIGLGNFQR